jgi:hypothetical protein
MLLLLLLLLRLLLLRLLLLHAQHALPVALPQVC